MVLRKWGFIAPLFLVACTTSSETETDSGIHPDARSSGPDAFLLDSGLMPDATPQDAQYDSGAHPVDASSTTDAIVHPDAAASDAIVHPDANVLDSGRPDSGRPDSGNACPGYQTAEPVSDSPLHGEQPLGRSEATHVNGYDDEYIYDSSDYIKIGVRREWGGTVIFYGLANGSAGMNNTNTIDANDTGREVQVALYDRDRIAQNCAWNASCQSTPSTCPSSITFLGWNPVQGGNRCNNGSGVQTVDNANGVLRVVTRPFEWNPNWDRQDCSDSACSSSRSHRQSTVELTQSLRFVAQHIVELRYTVRNLNSDSHAATVQEMPTMYTGNGQGGPNLRNLVNSAGTVVPIDVPAGNADGFFYKNFTSPEPWVTLQDDNNTYGVGIYYENGERDFQGWQHPGVPFNNVRAQVNFGLPGSGVVHARAYLILGGFSTISTEAAWLKANLAPFGVVDNPAEGVTVTGTTQIRGWALDNLGVTSIVARIDESISVPLNYGGSRPDVCLVWTGYPGCNSVGYSGTFDFSTLQSSCNHLLEIVATDGDGNQRTIARRLVYVGP